MSGTPSLPIAESWFEASARQRLAGLLDPGSFRECLGPEARECSPHLSLFDLPRQFDDGMITGAGRLAGREVFVAAQEGRFMGGTFGEVHGAKLCGLLRAARHRSERRPVLVLFDTGGVRLQEANAGELAVAEIIRALIEARHAGVPVLGLIGGRAGCYGGGGLMAACCSALIVSEPGRIGVSGPEVIETHHGIEAFDAKDRALVWRTMGGKHRRLLGGAEAFADDSAASMRENCLRMLATVGGGPHLEREQARLERRLQRYGDCTEALDLWRRLGACEPERIPELDYPTFIQLADRLSEACDDAR